MVSWWLQVSLYKDMMKRLLFFSHLNIQHRITLKHHLFHLYFSLTSLILLDS